MLIDDENVEMEIEAANEADKLGDDKIKDTEMEEVEEEAMSLYKQIKKDVSSSKELRRNVPVQEFVKTKNI